MKESDFPLVGKTIVFIGALHTLSRANQRDIAAHFGAKCSSVVSADTAFIVVGTDHVSEQKVRHAERQGVPIYDEAKLLELIAFKPFAHLLFEAALPKPATQEQLTSIEKFYRATVGPDLTEGQATTLLSIRDYVRAVTRIIVREGGVVGIDIETVVAAWIVNDPDLSEYVTSWNARRFARGTHHCEPRLRRDAHFTRIYDKMREVAAPYGQRRKSPL